MPRSIGRSRNSPDCAACALPATGPDDLGGEGLVTPKAFYLSFMGFVHPLLAPPQLLAVMRRRNRSAGQCAVGVSSGRSSTDVVWLLEAQGCPQIGRKRTSLCTDRAGKPTIEDRGGGWAAAPVCAGAFGAVVDGLSRPLPLVAGSK